MSGMSKLSETGAGAIFMLTLVVETVLLIGAVAFGGWAYQQMTKYKDNAQGLINNAVATAVTQTTNSVNATRDEQDKSPLRTYSGPSQYGSISVQYPKSWSAYVDDTDGGQNVVNGYFAPSTVPSLTNQNSVFALRVQVLQQTYDQVAQSFSGTIQGGKLAATAYSLPNQPGSVGLRLVGALPDNKNGDMVVIPIRNLTLEVWTDGPNFENDFNNYILKNINFAP